MIGIIYKITNDVNNKVYIGQTTSLIENRWERHCEELDNTKFHKAIKEIGKEHFTISVIEKPLVKDLDEREIYWISKYDSYLNGYNSTIGGKGTKRASFYTNENDMKNIIDLYINKQYSIYKIAKLYKVDKTTINKFLLCCNIPIRSPFRFTPNNEEKLDIINSYKAGESLKSLGKRYDTEGSTIKRFLVNNNIEIGNKSTVLLNENLCKEIAKDYASHNVSISYTKSKYHICFSTLKKILKDNNIPIRHLSGHISLTEKDVPNIKKLYEEGISIYRIATKYKVSKQCMYNFLYKYNIKENINIPRVSRP